MDRRNFLKSSGMLATGWASAAGWGPRMRPLRLSAAEGGMVDDNPNLADPALGVTCVRVINDFIGKGPGWKSPFRKRKSWVKFGYRPSPFPMKSFMTRTHVVERCRPHAR